MDELWEEIVRHESEVRHGNDIRYNQRRCVEKLGELIDKYPDFGRRDDSLHQA